MRVKTIVATATGAIMLAAGVTCAEPVAESESLSASVAPDVGARSEAARRASRDLERREIAAATLLRLKAERAAREKAEKERAARAARAAAAAASRSSQTKSPPKTTRVGSRNGSDPTVGLSRSERQRVSFSVWLASPTRNRVVWRESHGVCTITNPSGKYQGAYQMDDGFWRAYGGLAYAPNPHQATCAEQDRVAYRGWLARGWQPWPTA